MKLQTKLFLVTLLPIYIFSQNRIIIHGEVLGKQSVENIHVFNETSSKGEITNSQGKFSIKVALNDILVVTSIQYYKKTILINNKILQSRNLKIALKLAITNLDEVVIKKHNLFGNLYTDIEKVPDTFEQYKNYKLYISKLELTQRIENRDLDDLKKATDASKLTNPNATDQINLMPIVKFLYKNAKKTIFTNKKKKQREKIKKIKIKIREFYTDNYFINELGIPRSEIAIFIKYCEPKNIVELYLNNQKLELIEVLINESKKYLKEKN